MIAELLAAAALAAHPAGAAKSAASFVPYATGLHSPIYVGSTASRPDDLYVVEQPGTIRILSEGKVTRTFLDIRNLVRSGGEQGLLSMAFSPRYASDRRFYVSYTDRNGDSRVVEYRSNGTRAIASSARRLLFVHQPYPNHNGGQLQFDRGYLYFGLGDGGSEGDPNQASENLSSRLGKLLRTNPRRAHPVWQTVGYGLRNPWRFSFDSATHDLWIGDVGQNAWEEIDVRPAAKVGALANYGWSRYEGKTVYSAGHRLATRGQLVFPAAVYHHDSGRCSITGGYVYRGSAVPGLVGSYVYGDYCTGEIWSLRRGAAAPLPLGKVDGGLSSFGVDMRGELYATALNGTVSRLAP